MNPNTLGEKPKVYGRTNLGRKPRLSYINLVSEPNLITPFQQPKITSDNPHPHPPVENKSATRYAITQILTPRDLQTKATPFLTSRDLQTRARTNSYHIPPLATQILHPKTNKETHYSLQAYDPHPCPTLRPPPDQNQISLKANEQSPMSLLESRYQDPPTPTSRQHCSHHVVSCFTGSITAI